MFGKNEETSSEPQQIIILTLAMTAGGFLLLYLFLQFYLIPGLRQEIGVQGDDYSKLVTALESSEMKQLRHEAKLQDENDQQQSLGEIIVEKIGIYGLKRSKQAPKRPPLRTSRGGGREAVELQAEGVSIKLENAPLDKIIRFVASVQEAKNSIRVENFEVRRATRTRSGTAEDSWTADVDLADYATRKPPGGGSQ